MATKFRDYDVIVVGGRCAGAATAMLLAQGGARTLVIERQAYGSDALSTHALMRPAVMQLARWGLLDPILASGTPVITAATFHYDDETVSVSIRPEPGIPGVVAPRRTVLDRVLIDAARDAGAEVIHDASVVDVLRGRRGRVCGVVVKKGVETFTVQAGMVIGADGIGSVVARAVAAPTVSEGRFSAATIFGYAPLPATDGYDWYFRNGLSAGAIPTNDGEACLFVAAPQAYYDSVLRFDRANCHYDVLNRIAPELAGAVDKVGIGPLKAFRGRPGYIRQAIGPGWMLVGDAGFFRDPLSSHGISDAFRDAEAAAAAVSGGSQWDMEAYQAVRDEFAHPLLDVSDAICAFDWTPEVVKQHHRQLSRIIKDEVCALERRRTGHVCAGTVFAAPAAVAAE